MKPAASFSGQRRIVAGLLALPTEVVTLKRLQTESGLCPQPTLGALPPILQDAFTGES
jgi:hypothetical protein